MAVEEATPLLSEPRDKPDKKEKAVPRILFSGVIISLSVAFTWVPMIYVFRLMTCEEYYKTHSPFTGEGDRCSINEIEASTASEVSLLGTTTTIFGVLNLFWAGWSIKRFGVKAALIQQTVWPALRLCCQVAAVAIGARTGMLIIQITQFICALGGPAGYLLALNTYATEVVEPARRTVVFGQLQGCVMFGTAFGYFLGGLAGDLFGIRRPFEIAFFLMIFSTIYSAIFLPYIPPPELSSTDESSSKQRRKRRGLSGLVGPLRVFVPQKFRLPNGRIISNWGVILLGLGVFWGVLATGFIPVLIQMYATDAFGFLPTDNGYLMSFNSLIRGIFLGFIFPIIISRGRKWFASSSASSPSTSSSASSGEAESADAEEPAIPSIPATPEAFEPVPGAQSEQEPTPPPAITDASHGSAFDLFFLKWSLVVDGLLTGSAAFSRTGWHIYLAAFLLPLASGSAPAAKSVIMEMCEPADRADALSAITIVEMIATLSTMSVFGLVFSYLAEIGQPHLVFICNAAVAGIAVFILAFSRFPPADAERVVSSEPDPVDAVST